MENQPSIYDLLAKSTLTDIKTTDIHTAQSRTYADIASFDFWQGVMMLSKAVEVSRTFASGNLPIYNTGKNVSAALADGADITHTPAGTEIWKIQAISPDSCTVALRDSAGVMVEIAFDGGAAITVPPSDLYITSSQSLFFQNGTGSSKTPSFAYIKVSL
tara:strand:+ start:308 stop:787 length:480 start_codon:yes stop_codon:yes gene_type:complete